MFKHILVPLDGSAAAEAALPAALATAARSGGAVTLLHIVERAAAATVHGERHLRTEAEADAYLKDLAASRRSGTVTVNGGVRAAAADSVAEDIVACLPEFGADAVVMVRHGRPDLQRIRLGSLAQRVVSLGTMPVLLVPAAKMPEETAAEFSCRRVLIPHDAKPIHEPVWPVASRFVEMWRAEVRLLMVVPTRRTLGGPQRLAAHLLPAVTEEILDAERTMGGEHLERHVAHFRRAGLKVTAEIVRGDPSRSIVRAADAFQADVVVMGTHGRAGTRAFWAGSTAARVCARTRAAVLLVPLGRETGGEKRSG